MANSVNEAEEQKVGVGRYDLQDGARRAVREFTPLPPIGGDAPIRQPEVVTHSSDTQDSNNTAFAVLFS